MFNSYVDRNGDMGQFTGQGNLIRQNIFIFQFSYLLASQTNTKIFFNIIIGKHIKILTLPNNLLNLILVLVLDYGKTKKDY